MHHQHKTTTQLYTKVRNVHTVCLWCTFGWACINKWYHYSDFNLNFYHMVCFLFYMLLYWCLKQHFMFANTSMDIYTCTGGVCYTAQLKWLYSPCKFSDNGCWLLARAAKPILTQFVWENIFYTFMSLPDNAVSAIAGGAGGGGLLLVVIIGVLICILIMRRVHSTTESKYIPVVVVFKHWLYFLYTLSFSFCQFLPQTR